MVGETPIFAAVGKAAVSREELEHSRLFHDVCLESIEHLLNACSVRSLTANEVLIRRGEQNDQLYVLLSGRLRVHLEATEEPTAMLGPGDTVGELSILDRQAASAFVVAHEPCRLLAISSDIAWHLIDGSHAVARNLLGILSQRQRSGNAVIAHGKRLQRHYERQALTDELTGLHNRRWFDDVLPRLVNRNALTNQALSLVIADIDQLGSYNEEFGFEAGDHVLYAVSQTLINHLRPTDLLARYRDGQFAILLPDTDLAGAHVAAERVRKVVAETVVELSDESILPPVPLSLGVAERQPGEGPGALLKRAMAALKLAKTRRRVGTAASA